MPTITDELKSTLDFVEAYRTAPNECLKEYYEKTGIPRDGLILESGQIAELIEGVPLQIKEAIDYFIARMLRVNCEITAQVGHDCLVDGMRMRPQAVASCGMYVPYRFVSSLITWVTAAKAAGVERRVVYLPVDKESGLPCAASLYAAQRLGATALCGPARFAFPALAFGSPGHSEPVDLLCGPAGYRLNLIKQLSALMSGARADFFAGPSDLAVLVTERSWLPQAVYDLQAQLEHGPDSRGYLIVVGESVDVPDGVTCIAVDSLPEAAQAINTLSPETVELYGSDAHGMVDEITNFGVLYCNFPSTLGDYMVIGRGCGDPTNGRARSYAGISPFTFMRHQALIEDAYVEPQGLEYGSTLAGFEQMFAHQQAMTQWKNMQLANTKD